MEEGGPADLPTHVGSRVVVKPAGGAGDCKPGVASIRGRGAGDVPAWAVLPVLSFRQWGTVGMAVILVTFLSPMLVRA